LDNQTEIKEPSPPSIDDKASKEVDYLFLENKRKNELLTVAHKITLVLLVITVAIIVIVGGLRLIHLILPDHCKWLTNEDIMKIDEFFIHGTFGH